MTSAVIEIRPLTGFRGVAATMVFLFHMFNQAGDIFELWKPMPAAQLMVDAFFVMSGHIICHVYASIPEAARPVQWKSFFIARFSRIYPLHLLSMAFLFGLFCLESILTQQWSNITADPRFSMWGIIKEILLLQAFPDAATVRPWIYTSWSISVEWYLYLFAFPFACLLIRFHRKAIFLVTGAVVVTNLIWLGYYGNESMWTSGWTAWLRGLSGFLTGASLWFFQAHNKNIKRQRGGVTDCSLALFLVLNVLLSVLLKQPPWLLVFLVPVVINGLCAGKGKGKAAQWLATPVAVFLGNISYSVYLLHPLVLLVMKQACAMGLVKSVGVYVIGSALMVFPMAAVIYFKFEVPARDIIKRKFSRSLPSIAITSKV